MTRPLLLDLFCGAGGAGMGYWRAGFDVIGVDIAPQPRYPFPFIQADALQPPADLERFQAIHASPPCQGYSRMRHLPWLAGNDYPLLIDPTRDLLESSGLPWVIENVEDSPLERAPTLFGNHGVLLCGSMFGLPVYRHRPFESNRMLVQPNHGAHDQVITKGRHLGPRCRLPVHGRISAWQAGGGGKMGNVDRVRQAMGIDWMSGREIGQAIPPAYTEHIGAQLLAAL